METGIPSSSPNMALDVMDTGKPLSFCPVIWLLPHHRAVIDVRCVLRVLEIAGTGKSILSRRLGYNVN